eukprot:3403577-Pyramimonas_sp.AAC.1
MPRHCNQYRTQPINATQWKQCHANIRSNAKQHQAMSNNATTMPCNAKQVSACPSFMTQNGLTLLGRKNESKFGFRWIRRILSASFTVPPHIVHTSPGGLQESLETSQSLRIQPHVVMLAYRKHAPKHVQIRADLVDVTSPQ